MSSFAEQLAARAAKRTGSDSAPTSSVPSPSRRIIGENNNNNGSSTIGSSPSRTATSLSEQIKSRAVDRNNSGRSKSGDDNGRAEKKSATATTDETLNSSTQQIIQKQSPIKKSSSSSSRSKRTNETNNNPSGSKVSAAKVVPQQQQRRRADDLDSLFNETDDTNDESTSYIPAKLHATKSRSPSPQIPTTTDSATARTASPEQTKLKAKLDKYKSENKKLRHESLLLKAKLEEMASLLTKLQQLESKHKVENEELKVRVGELTQKILQLEMSKLNNGGEEEDDEYEWNGIRSSKERSVQQQRRASLTTNNSNTVVEEGRMSALSVDTFAEMDKEDLVAENVRLTQLMLDMEGLDELQKLANAAQNGGSNDGGKNGRNDTSSGGDDEEKDAAISALNKKVSQIEDELTEVTELKNAEIDVLRKQLNRVEQQQHNRNNNNNNNSNSPQDATANMEQQQQQWNKEREELREEIRRLNLEVSRQMSNRLDQEEEDDNARYNGTSSSSSSTSLFITSPKNLDNSDISSLQSIIGMMRQTIDQSTKEKEELEQRLAEEQERSQNELKAFAKTLEGVDDLRKSAETMSREIRRIKVKGYRPTRSDLMGGGGDLNGVRNFGELTAAVEASENMEDAIRLIEGQNDALEERRRMGVVAASQSLGGGGATNAPPAPQARKGSIGLRAISEDDNDEGGFLSFWNGAGRTNNDDEDDDNDNDEIAKREKKKKSKRKKKRDDEGSVFTSFF